MDFVALGHSVRGISDGLFHALAIFTLTVAPYLYLAITKGRFCLIADSPRRLQIRTTSRLERLTGYRRWRIFNLVVI